MLDRHLFALTVTIRITPTPARRMVTTVLAGSPVAFSSGRVLGITAGFTEVTDSMAVLATVAGDVDMDITATDLVSSDMEQLVVGSEVVKHTAVAVSTVAEVSTVEAATAVAVVIGKLRT
jgi:hypothetical protein